VVETWPAGWHRQTIIANAMSMSLVVCLYVCVYVFGGARGGVGIRPREQHVLLRLLGTDDGGSSQHQKQ